MRGSFGYGVVCWVGWCGVCGAEYCVRVCVTCGVTGPWWEVTARRCGWGLGVPALLPFRDEQGLTHACGGCSVCVNATTADALGGQS